MQKPTVKPNNPNFSSGPCSKRPGWDCAAIVKDAFLGRSHRAARGKDKLKDVIERHRAMLDIPADYKIGIVPASDTGAIEMALWSMIGARPVDVLVWENFSNEWWEDVVGQFKLRDTRTFKVDYGDIVDLSQVDTKTRDVVFVWNGTTSGVRIPNHDWIAETREGLTFCDATSAVFAYEMDWSKLDVTTWSWQKVLGGEAAHGMIVLSPRAVERLLSYVPDRPLPKIFRMVKKDKLMEGIFVGETINTPSMLAVEDCLDALKWVESLGGWKATSTRCQQNLKIIEDWVEKTPWIEFLPKSEDIRSRTSICLSFVDDDFAKLDDDNRKAFVKDMTSLLSKENAAHDIASYAAAPAGLRIWGGATIEADDFKALLPWLEWAFAETKTKTFQRAA